MMTKGLLATFIGLTAAALAFAAPASAKFNCDEGYKGFMMKLSTHMGTMSETDLSALMRRGLGILDACNAGDNYIPTSAWDAMIDEVTKKEKH
jgi:hypothetical protein